MRPSRTPSNGLETANQNETFQPDSLVIELVFTLLSQAFEDRHFRNLEIFSRERPLARDAPRSLRDQYYPTTSPTGWFLLGRSRREPLNDCFELRIAAQRVPEWRQFKCAVTCEVGPTGCRCCSGQFLQGQIVL